MTFQNFNVYEGLTSVRLASINNIVGTYTNGNQNNGTGAFIVIQSSTFSIDSELVNIGDSILLAGQTNANENGIYSCIQTGGIFSFSVIQRRPDFQSIEQIRAGQYITVSDGILYKGSMFCVVEPLPRIFGIDPLLILNSSNTFKVNSFDETDFSGTSNFDILTILGGSFTTFENPINNPAPQDPQIIIDGNIVKMNGITQGFVIGDAELFLLSGTYTSNAFVLGHGIDIDMATATVNGAAIVGNLINIMSIGTPSNIVNVIPELIINSSGITLESIRRVTGDFNYYDTLETATTYFLAAGIGAGQAGDPAGCGAQEVLRIRINGSDRFIPIFDTN